MQGEDRQTQEAFDAVTGEAMALTPPRVEDQVLVPRSEAGRGLDPVEFAKPSFESALERFRSAGQVDVDPEDPALFNAYRRSVDYLGDMALGGLDLSDAAFRAAVGIVSQALPENQERSFARDLAAMPEAFMGYSPGRIQAAADRVAEGVGQVGRNLNQPGPMPTLGSNLGNLSTVSGPTTSSLPLFRQTPDRLGMDTVARFYSPAFEAVQNASFPNRGMRGADLEKLLRNTPEVRNNEVRALDLAADIDPQRRYTREEALELFEPLQFNVRAERATSFSNTGSYPHEDVQRQDITHQQGEYHETLIRAERGGDDMPTFRAAGGTHHTPDTIAHLRTSTRYDDEGNKYYLVEEIQSDLVSRGAARPGPARSQKDALREHFDSVIFPEMQRRYKNNPETAPVVDGTQDDWFLVYQRAASGFNPRLDLGLTDEVDERISSFSQTLNNLSTENNSARKAISSISEGIEQDAFFASTNMDELMRPTSEAPIRDISEVVRISLQTAISDALQSGANSIVVPNLERIVASGRALPNTEAFEKMTREGSAFHRTYVTGLESALEEIRKELPEITVDEVELPYRQGRGESLPTTATRINIGAYADTPFNVLRFAEGGVVEMEEQMSLFDMGGLTDDGAMRDPVSGNEVPPGSMASEVRDDVPAMLSEGEYIVPADVVRFFGVKFFEDLRNQAKSGLMEMEQGGRIGGEPVGAPEDDLTPEEMQMLAEITGMYMGGDVRRPAEKSMSVSEALANMSVYEAINSPVRVFTPEGAEATTPEMKRELFRNMGLIQIAEDSQDQTTRAFQEGGMVNQPFTPIPNYATPGFSLFQPVQTAASTPAPVQTQNVTLYGPNGEVVTLTLPTDQERYNQLLGQGYTTQPRALTDIGVTTGGDSGATSVAPTAATTGGGRERDYKPLDPDDYNAMLNDPIAFGSAALEGRDLTRFLGGLGSLILGPLGSIVGGGVGASMTAQNVAQARAASQIAKAKGLDTTELDAQIKSYIKGLPNLARGATELLGAGDQMAERFFKTGRDLSLPGAQYGDSPFTRDFFAPGPAGDEAFRREMETTAPPGMTYNPVTETYVRDESGPDLGERLGGTRIDTGSEGTPVFTPGPSTPRPVQRPTTRPDGTPVPPPPTTTPAPTPPTPSDDRDDDRDSGADTNVGNYSGDRDGDGVPNWRDFNDGVGWADNNKDESKDTSGACFLTTAVVEMRGESDDGYTLSTLRKFRDTYLRNKNNEVERYYEVAPKLVRAIPKEDKTWLWIGKRVDKAIQYIEEGKDRLAYQTYKRMVEKLERDWLKEK